MENDRWIVEKKMIGGVGEENVGGENDRWRVEEEMIGAQCEMI